MAIYRLLKDTTFEREAVEAMGRAYEDLLTDLRLADRNDPFTETVAKEIVRIASRAFAAPPSYARKSSPRSGSGPKCRRPRGATQRSLAS